MKIKMSDEAQPLWDKLGKEDQKFWTSNVYCQKCKEEIKATDFSGSIYEEQLALFHCCQKCGNKEVRLIEIDEKRQEDIDDDFENWVKAKKAANPEKYGF